MLGSKLNHVSKGNPRELTSSATWYFYWLSPRKHTTDAPFVKHYQSRRTSDYFAKPRMIIYRPFTWQHVCARLPSTTFREGCTRSRFQGQGEVITSHRCSGCNNLSLVPLILAQHSSFGQYTVNPKFYAHVCISSCLITTHFYPYPSLIMMPLPEPMLTCYQPRSVTFIWG